MSDIAADIECVRGSREQTAEMVTRRGYSSTVRFYRLTERERERARVHATSLDASNRTFHFCNLKEVDRPVSSASLPRPPSAFDPFCSLPRVALSRRCAAPRSLLETSVEGYLAPYTVIFRFTMIPANAFGSLAGCLKSVSLEIFNVAYY